MKLRKPHPRATHFVLGAALALIAAPLPTVLVRAEDKPAITVSAAASLKDVLTEIDGKYTGAIVNVTYGSSGSLQRQIEEGAPVDVFISAAAKNMDQLSKANLVDTASRRDVAANRLVLVVPSGGKPLHSFKDLGKPTVVRFAMGEPESVPAGSYAREVLTNLKIYQAVQPKAVYGKDVRGGLSQVEEGNVDAGIVYRTDALTTAKVKIVAVAPAKLHQPILYPAAVVTDSRNKAAATAYLRFLSGPVARKIFKSYGFLAPKG